MSLTFVISIIIFGLLLLLLEILVIPGGIAGIIGILCVIIGVFGAYRISAVHGHVALVSSGVLSGLLIYLALKSNTWKRVSLHHTIEGKMNIQPDAIKEGDEGVAVSRLTPAGKAKINDYIVEVHSEDGTFVNENSKIVVSRVRTNKITVKPKI